MLACLVGWCAHATCQHITSLHMSEQEPPNLHVLLQPQPVMDRVQAAPVVEKFIPRPLTDPERATILPWRRKYLVQTVKTERYRIIKEEVLVAMFNHWDLIGEGLLARQQEPERIKVFTHLASSQIRLTLPLKMIMGFIQNNWCRPKTLQFDGAGDVVTRIHNLIYQTMRERVDAQITRILGLTEPVTTSNPKYFSSLSAGTSQVAQSLTPEEEAVLWDIREECRNIGNPPDVQRRYAALYQA